MTVQSHDKLEKLLDEWALYRGADLHLKKVKWVDVVDLSIERDEIDRDAQELSKQVIMGPVSEDLVRKFEADLDQFRQKLSINILENGA